MSIKNKNYSSITLKYLISFSVIILLFLWIVQIGFLKIFYERYRINLINNISDQINNFEGNLHDELERIAYHNEVCIELVAGGEVFGYNILNKDCILANKNKSITNVKADILKNGDKKYFVTIESPINKTKSLISGLKLNEEVFVFINTNLEDVNSTTSVLINQLIYITLVVILLAIIMSYFVSRMLDKPIIEITNKARDMATGNFKLDLQDYDIDEINELRNVLNYARSEIQNTENLRRDLMANVSHDLKTPLTMIKAYAEMAHDINCDNKKKFQENLKVIISETDRLNILVNDVLDLSKLESGKENLKLEKYDLVKAIKEILKRYDIVKETEEYNFKINMPKLAMVKADRNKIDQVIYNLVNNAINYTGKDLVVKINILEEKKHYLIEIKDTGKGISEKDLPLIWTKYYKKGKAHRRNVTGTGLGLSIVKNILSDHGFEYGVKSKKNKGSNFYFRITKVQNKKEKNGIKKAK